MTAKLIALAALITTAGCIKDVDYEGEYEMTYDVITESGAASLEARAGLAAVEIHEGSHDDFYLDLGASFCLLHATKGEVIDAFSEWPWLQIAPQPCWFSHAGVTYELGVAGTASYDDDAEAITIDLAGSFADEQGTRGTVTIRFDERW